MPPPSPDPCPPPPPSPSAAAASLSPPPPPPYLRCLPPCPPVQAQTAAPTHGRRRELEAGRRDLRRPPLPRRRRISLELPLAARPRAPSAAWPQAPSPMRPRAPSPVRPQAPSPAWPRSLPPATVQRCDEGLKGRWCGLGRRRPGPSQRLAGDGGAATGGGPAPNGGRWGRPREAKGGGASSPGWPAWWWPRRPAAWLWWPALPLQQLPVFFLFFWKIIYRVSL